MAAPARPNKIPGRPSTMPVRAGSSSPAAQAGPEALAPIGAGEPLDLPGVDSKIFEPDPATLRKLNAKGPKALEKAQAKSREQVVQIIHALRLLSPGIVGVMTSSLNNGSEPDQAQQFAAWVGEIRQQAADWAARWEVAEEDLPWVTASLERFLAEHPGAANTPLLEHVTEWVGAHVPPPPANYIPVSAAAPLALLQALGPVQRVQAAYPLGRREPERDLEMIAQLLVEAATDAVNELVEPAAPNDVRSVVFTSVLVDSGKTMAQLWVSFAQTHLNKWRQKTAAEQELWHKANPHGVGLEPLFEQFQSFSARLRRLTRAARLRR